MSSIPFWPATIENLGRVALAATIGLIVLAGTFSSLNAAEPNVPALEAAYQPKIRPLLKKHCHECHSANLAEAEIDLSEFNTLADVRKQLQVWQKVGEMLDSRQMPPKDALQPNDSDRARLQQWVREFLTHEARAHAGDPGRVVLRRLNNAEYTYTLRDLTGVASLDPAREFPVDGAAGEGFTNTGNALVMSPALVTKYLDAAKQVASHAVLLPDGFRFSEATTRADWSQEALAKIRQFYARYTDTSGGTAVDLQGIKFQTNQGGRLPIEKYLQATLSEREALTSGAKTVAQVAGERGLNAKYLQTLWTSLTAPSSGKSLLLDRVRARWKSAKPTEVTPVVSSVDAWQQALWKFNPVGHFGRAGAPQGWMTPVSPLAKSQELRYKFPDAADGQDVVLYLRAMDAGDGNEQDFAIWERPRLVVPGRPDLLLKDARAVSDELTGRRERVFNSTAACLNAASEILAAPAEIDVKSLAAKHQVDTDALIAWLDYLGIGTTGPVKLGTPIPNKSQNIGGYAFVRGWTGADALSVVANSSDKPVRIPGNVAPHSVVVHPTPTRTVAIGWKCPERATTRIEGVLQHAHPECGNGTEWTLELRRGSLRQRLASGVSQRAKEVPIGPIEKLAIQPGDVLVLGVGANGGNHSCDLTRIDLTITAGKTQWKLSRDLSPDILAGNPHADEHGNADTWHFFSEAQGGSDGAVIPAGSLLSRWQATESATERRDLAQALERLVKGKAPPADKNSADAKLYQQLTSLRGPLLTAALRGIAAKPNPAANESSSWGLSADQFGKHPLGATIDPASLCVQAPQMIEVRLPAALVAGAELATTGTLDATTSPQGSVQFTIARDKETYPLTSNSVIVTPDGSPRRAELDAAFEEFRQLFPPGLCYTKIVPVDEVVTLTLYFREDQHLQRLMLSEEEIAQIDRLWDELLFISQEPILLTTVFEQLSEFATQDRADIHKALEPMRQPLNERANKFRQRLVDLEPRQLDELLAFANRAFRRPLTSNESQQLRNLYFGLRQQEIGHDEAFRLTMARMLVAPAFLYRLEKPPTGDKQQPVSNLELANRLSYFLWSSQPDDELRRVAEAGQLTNSDVLLAQTHRMLRDPRARRMAIEFAGQWLHIHDFAELNEKSERHFPTFAGLRNAMFEESIQFLTDAIQNDRSLLSLIDADHTFLNEDLAKHYGIPNVNGPEWRRVDGVRQYSRGGVFTQATTLAKQSGASRTSPILRGNWLSEVVLGEKLPRPPKDVPQLDDVVPAGLTERQLIEKHSTVAACAKCHVRIDPLGFALENFDAIGRYRDRDANGHAIDSKTTLPDGTKLDGLRGLQTYLATTRRDAFVRQFCRKLLGYALGRSVQLSDEPLLAEMQELLKKNDYKFGTAIESVVESRQFRDIRGVSAEP